MVGSLWAANSVRPWWQPSIAWVGEAVGVDVREAAMADESPGLTADVLAALYRWPGSMARAYDALVPPPRLPPREPGMSREAREAQRQAVIEARYFHTWKRYAATSYIVGVGLPLILCLLLGPRRLGDVGLRWPNAASWRLIGVILAIGAIVGMPFVLAMASDEQFIDQYRYWHESSPWFVPFTLSTLIPEHVLLHGVVLAWLIADRRFPRPEEVALPLEPPWRRRADHTLAFAPMRLIRSLWIPSRCWLPVVLSGVLFWACHVGKNPVETALSFPGGIACAYLAYRTASLLTPLLLHLATAAIAFGVAIYLL